MGISNRDNLQNEEPGRERMGEAARNRLGSDHEAESGSPDQIGKIHKDFSAYNREIRDQVDPETGQRVRLLTKKQLAAEKARIEKLLKKLESF